MDHRSSALAWFAAVVTVHCEVWHGVRHEDSVDLAMARGERWLVGAVLAWCGALLLLRCDGLRLFRTCNGRVPTLDTDRDDGDNIAARWQHCPLCHLTKAGDLFLFTKASQELLVRSRVLYPAGSSRLR